jgi:hypothetical protein
LNRKKKTQKIKGFKKWNVACPKSHISKVQGSISPFTPKQICQIAKATLEDNTD